MMTFSKYQGAGNDFLVADNRLGGYRLSQQDIVRLCDRRYGFGGDGLMLLTGAQGDADFRMVFYNPDGSSGMMCGNGGRCIAAFAAKLFADGRKDFRFEAADGLHTASIASASEDFSETVVRLGMIDVRELRRTPMGVFVNTGTRHLVRFCEGVADMDIVTPGRELRHAQEFAPEGTNVNFAEITGKDSVLVRTYEKGVEDETFACGTGIVATCVAAWHEGLVNPGEDGRVRVAVRAKRDSLSVDFLPGGRQGGVFAKDVFLTGPAVFVGTVTDPRLP